MNLKIAKLESENLELKQGLTTKHAAHLETRFAKLESALVDCVNWLVSKQIEGVRELVPKLEPVFKLIERPRTFDEVNLCLPQGRFVTLAPKMKSFETQIG